MKPLLVIPEFIYSLLFHASIIVAFVSILMLVISFIRKSEKKAIIKWCVILVVTIAVFYLLTCGLILADTMLQM